MCRARASAGGGGRAGTREAALAVVKVPSIDRPTWVPLPLSLLPLPLCCRPPEAMNEIMGLQSKKCVPCEGGVQALGETDVNRLAKQVGGARGLAADQIH